MAGALTAAIASIFSGSAVTADPYYEYTTLLLPGNGTNGAQNNTFLDGSTNNFTITRNGNTTQGTFSPFSQTGWGNYFDGNGDYLTLGGQTALAMGSGDFTIEFWAYLTSTAANPTLFDTRGSGTAGGTNITLYFSPGGILNYYANGSIQISSSAFPTNTWTHVAVSRASGSTRMFFNGVQQGSTYPDSTTYTVGTSRPIIGADGYSTGINAMTGYLSDVRILKGTGYSTITVPTAPLTAITNTALLTCQSNRFRDASSNNFTITVNGNTSVQAFSPFNPTSSWSAATYGGSGYFDGNGDYLTTPNVTALNLYNVTNTVECWVYPLSFSTQFQLYGTDFDGTYYTLFEILATSGYPRYISRDGTAITGSSGITLNQWNHVAFGRSGSTQSIWVNGIRVASGTITTEDQWGTAVITIGRWNTENRGNGYLSSLRVVKGTDVYGVSNTTITVPTAPLTAITNTSLLLNFTNAGIYDATSKNDLETVGNAQISNTTAQFGSTSIKFDGTGDYLVTDNSDNILGFGTGDWTIEFWLRLNSTGTQVIFDGRRSSSADVAPLIYYLSGLKYYTAGGDRISGSTLSTGVWYYIAIVKSSGSTRMYIDGSQTGSTYTDGNNYTQQSQRPIIGAEGVSVGSNPLNGYIQDLRITKGYARTITTPTAAFPTL